MRIIINRILLFITIFLIISVFSMQVFATNIEIIKNKTEDDIKISIEKTKDNEDEIIIKTSIQGEYYKEEKQGSYLANINVEYKFTEDILKYFDFSIVKNPNLGELVGSFENNDIKWNIDSITNNEEVYFRFKLKIKENDAIEEKIYPIFTNIVYKYNRTGFVIEDKEARSYTTPKENNITDVPEIRIINAKENNNNENTANTREDNSNNDKDSIYNSNGKNDVINNNNEDNANNQKIADNQGKNNQKETNNTLKSVSPNPLPNTGIKSILKIMISIIIIISIGCVYKIRKN